MSDASSAVEVRNNHDESRYEALIGGGLAGVAVYVLQGEASIIFTHTEVLDAFEGKGVGSALARFALDDVRREGTRQVVPRCPFIRGWIEKHPDYADLVRS